MLAVAPSGAQRLRLEVPGRTQVEFARPLPGGRILCVSVDEGVTLLEPDGHAVFEVDMRAHHEAVVVPDGRPEGARRFAVLVHDEFDHAGRAVRFDGIVLIDEATGTEVGEGWTFDTHAARERILDVVGLQEHPLDRPGRDEAEAVYDYFHANGLAFDGPSRVVLCLRNVDALVTVDLSSGEVVGAIGPGTLDWPHAPSFVRGPDGSRRLLAFDNGKHRGWSRVVELDPASGEVLWEWRGTDQRPLWSELRGYAQRLPGGRTLVTESERGRAMEIDAAGRVVWEFLNPETRAVNGGGRARRRIYRMLASADRPAALEDPPGESGAPGARERPPR
ncbi:MAG: arylsulfotransferase family protein [Planctomycetota bacterium]|nr:arylsulfotransferase family protein [Planctomycetota bacterium]